MTRLLAILTGIGIVAYADSLNAIPAQASPENQLAAAIGATALACILVACGAVLILWAFFGEHTEDGENE